VAKLVGEQGSGRILGVHLLADGDGDAILAGVYAVQAGMTVQQMADSWNPYLTIGEAVHLAAQSFTRDPAGLSCWGESTRICARHSCAVSRRSYGSGRLCACPRPILTGRIAFRAARRVRRR
jgi:hypothetical protein